MSKAVELEEKILLIRFINDFCTHGGFVMKRSWIMILALCLCLLCGSAGAESGLDAYLDPEDLQSLQPVYEAFLRELADVLIEKDLLEEEDVEEWVMYQLGDYIQNGGSGSFLISYTPGLLSLADDSTTMRRFTCKTAIGVFQLDTLRCYSPSLSSLPGLPLDAELTGTAGYPVPCRFRWVAGSGSFQIWDGAADSLINTGATYINQDRALYWFDEPVDGVTEVLTLEILSDTEDRTLASITVTLESANECWYPVEVK